MCLSTGLLCADFILGVCQTKLLFALKLNLNIKMTGVCNKSTDDGKIVQSDCIC